MLVELCYEEFTREVFNLQSKNRSLVSYYDNPKGTPYIGVGEQVARTRNRHVLAPIKVNGRE